MNGTLIQYFDWYYPPDGSLWLKIQKEAKKLAEMGITALWLPPAYKAASGMNSTGYDVYDLYDLGEFDQKGGIPTKYGTKEEYLQAIKSVHEQGLSVYADIVLNHKGGGDEKEKIKVLRVNPENRNEMGNEEFEIEAFTKFNFPGRAGTYSDFIWNYECFGGVDYAADLNENGIFTILNSYGKEWEEGVDEEQGNFDYLMCCDVEFRNSIVREELKKWGKWYLKTTQIDGFRIDAAKHISYKFYNEWLDYLRQETGKELFTVGEYWSPFNVNSILHYLDRTRGRMSLFDAPLQKTFHEASKSGKDFDLRHIFDSSLLASSPNTTVTFVENHDTQPLQSLEETVDPWFKPLAYALILLREAGYPCLFYSDIYGSNYKDKGKDGKEYEINMPIIPGLEKMVQVRKKYAYGLQRDYFFDSNHLGWTREGLKEFPDSGCAVLVSNGEESQFWMEMGGNHSGKIFQDCINPDFPKVKINEEGWGEFRSASGNVSVYMEVLHS